MAKTEILNRLETHRGGFVSGLSKLTVYAQNYRAKLHAGPEPWHQFVNLFKADYKTTSQHLTGMHTAMDDFGKKVQSWDNPTILNTIKNLPKRKKLDEDRKTAKAKYATLTHDYEELKKSWTTVEQVAKRLEII